MKANHNTGGALKALGGVVVNISSSKNESKSQLNVARYDCN
ncbi:hypothetical protein SAMN05421813_1522 [Daejeonella rubra]|uniref:Uncharacterized protein n=1 Tax=Daejeonella rubra TaxID=990371 RepID=A0A1G9Z1S2_9SPHI|nr:hypothetical protein SAMN05421813_1522 [Daejeonella rubra]